MKLFSYQIYATQQEVGIKGDGRVWIDFTSGDYTVSDLHMLIDGLQTVVRVAGGQEGPRSGVYDSECQV